MRNSCRKNLLFAIMLSATMSAGAGVHYDEAISGDIAANGAIPKFEFALGLNSVSGSRSDYVTFDGERNLYKLDFDPFEVHLTGDLRVKSATAAFKFTPLTENLAAFDMRWHVFDFPGLSVQFTDCFSVLAGGRCRIDSDGGSLGSVQKWGRTRNFIVDPIAEYVPLDPSQTYGGTVEYVLSFAVAPIPEPRIHLLWLIGMPLLALGSRWRALR